MITIELEKKIRRMFNDEYYIEKNIIIDEQFLKDNNIDYYEFILLLQKIIKEKNEELAGIKTAVMQNNYMRR